MDFWRAYEKRRIGDGFGKDRLWLSSGERHNLSLSPYVEKSIELGSGRAAFIVWNPKRRYLIAKNIDFDLFVSFYDVNSKAVMALRLVQPVAEGELLDAEKRIAQMKNANLEMRAIGLQNNNADLVPSIRQLRELAGCGLVEADLFGNQTRHLIMDLLTGKPYGLLLENRIYRPGELITTVKKEDFEMMKVGLQFS